MQFNVNKWICHAAPSVKFFITATSTGQGAKNALSYFCSYARFKVFMSIFFICSIAFINPFTDDQYSSRRFSSIPFNVSYQNSFAASTLSRSWS